MPACAAVSNVALSEPDKDTLPATSVIVAVTVKVSPSSGDATVVNTSSAAICSAVKVMSVPFTVKVSPATALVSVKEMVTFTAPSDSDALM